LPMSFSICARTFFNSLLCDASAMFFPSWNQWMAANAAWYFQLACCP
jgi:hypothetical protein